MLWGCMVFGVLRILVAVVGGDEVYRDPVLGYEVNVGSHDEAWPG